MRLIGVTFISDCLAAKTAQNKEKGAENGIKFALNSKNSCNFAQLKKNRL